MNVGDVLGLFVFVVGPVLLMPIFTTFLAYRNWQTEGQKTWIIVLASSIVLLFWLFYLLPFLYKFMGFPINPKDLNHTSLEEYRYQLSLKEQPLKGSLFAISTALVAALICFNMRIKCTPLYSYFGVVLVFFLWMRGSSLGLIGWPE